MDDTNRAKRAKYYAAAFFLPFLIMSGIFIAVGIHPFGSRQVLVTDLWHQYFPFLQELSQKLKTGESLMFSWNSGMGTNFISTIAYYAASPLNLLTALVPRSALRDFTALMVAVRFGLCSLSFAVFAARSYKKLGPAVVLFSCMYAMCGFNLGYYWNTIWMDSVALLPLVILGVHRLYKERRCGLFIFAFALAMWCNYYIGYIIALFTMLYYIFLCVSEWEGVKPFFKKGFTMLFCTLLSAALTAVITYPAYLALAHSYSAGGSFPSRVTFYQSAFAVLADLLPVHGAAAKEGLPNIYCGLLGVFFALVYFRSPKFSLRSKIGIGALLAFIVLSFNMNVLNYIWHGFHFTNMVPYRFAFTFAFLLLCAALRGYEEADSINPWDITLCLAATVALVVMNDGADSAYGVVAGIALAVMYMLIMSLKKSGALTAQGFFCSLMAIALIEMCAQGALGVQSVMTTSYDTYFENNEEASYFIDKYSDSSAGGFYRIEMADWKTLNDPLLYGYRGISQFSSTAHLGVTEFLRSLGVCAPLASNRYYYNASTALVNAVTGVKYIISRDGKWVDTPFETLAETKNSSAIYENKYCLPLGFAAADTGVSLKDAQNPFEAQNRLFGALSGVQGTLFETLSDCEIDDGGAEISQSAPGEYIIRGSATGRTVTVTYKAPQSGVYYVYQNVPDANTVRINGFDVRGLKHARIAAAGALEADEELCVEIPFTASSKNSFTILAARIDLQLWQAGFERLADETLRVTASSSRSLEGIIDLKEPSSVVFSIPYDEGWALYVNGEKTPVGALDGALLCADLGAGENFVRLIYTTPGIVIGAVISLSALVCAAVFLIAWRKKQWT